MTAGNFGISNPKRETHSRCEPEIFIVSAQQLEYGLISFCELLFNFHILSGVRTWDAVRISWDAVRISWMQSEYSSNIENSLKG